MCMQPPERVPAQPGLLHEAASAQEAIVKAVPGATVLVPDVPLDLSSFVSVRAFGEELRRGSQVPASWGARLSRCARTGLAHARSQLHEASCAWQLSAAVRPGEQSRAASSDACGPPLLPQVRVIDVACFNAGRGGSGLEQVSSHTPHGKADAEHLFTRPAAAEDSASLKCLCHAGEFTHRVRALACAGSRIHIG